MTQNPITATALGAAADDTTWLKQAFANVQTALSSQMALATQSISHAGTMGSVNEEHWLSLLRSYLPNRYEVATGIVIDSKEIAATKSTWSSSTGTSPPRCSTR